MTTSCAERAERLAAIYAKRGDSANALHWQKKAEEYRKQGA